MKKIFNTNAVALFLVAFAMIAFVSCSKDDKAPQVTYASKAYKLYNLSTGTQVEAGTFTIYELSDGNARVTVQLNDGYKVPNVTLKGSITVTDAGGVELQYADLGDINGTSGSGEKSPLVSSATNSPIKYAEIINKTGYLIKILNGSNLQARGTIN